MRATACPYLVVVCGLTLLIGCGRERGPDRSQSGAKPAARYDGWPEPSESPPLAAEPAREATVARESEDPARLPAIYDPRADGREVIAAALQQATRDHKRVLIEWGGNWCEWCHRLHRVFMTAPGVKDTVAHEYVLVLLDSGTNHDLLTKLSGAAQHSVPFLTVMDASGEVLTNQNTEPFEDEHQHRPEIVDRFLKAWALPAVDAIQQLTSALEQARHSGKRVLLRVVTPSCPWCTVLSQFMHDHAEILSKDYLDLKIDSVRMKNGQVVAERFRPERCEGVPWFVILDAEGTTLQTSVGTQGNIGYPHQPDEIAHFMAMLRATRVSITDEELQQIKADLTADSRK